MIDIETKILESVLNDEKKGEIIKTINKYVLKLPKDIQEKIKTDLIIYLNKLIKKRKQDKYLKYTLFSAILYSYFNDKKAPKGHKTITRREVNETLIKYQREGITYAYQTATKRFKTKYYQEIKKRYDEYLTTTANTLSKIEMSYRAERQKNELKNLKEKGVKLVFISSHINCSKRCQPFQGKLYSLDGTKGTKDGMEYVPLEKATDIYYTTKKGVTYKNGCISGFNCRHKLIPYSKDKNFMIYKNENIEKKRNQEIKQRQIERQIRTQKKKIILDKYFKIDTQQDKEILDAMMQKYIKFTDENQLKRERIRLYAK